MEWAAGNTAHANDVNVFKNVSIVGQTLHASVGTIPIRSQDLVVHLYHVISEEMKKTNFSIWKLSSYWAGVSLPNYCVVTLF